MDSPVQFFINPAVPCIKAIIAGHFEVFFRDVLDEEFNEVQHWESTFHISIVFVAVIVEGNGFAVVGIDAFQCDHRTAKVAADVFYDRFGITKIRFGIDIETIFIFTVNESFCFFERRADAAFHFIEEGGLEGLAEINVAEMSDGAPEAVIRVTAFGDEAVDMRVPFERTAKSMKDTDETGHEVFGLIHIMEHTEYNAADSRKKAVEEGAVFEEEMAEFFINRENTMAVSAVDQFKRHVSGTFLAVLNSAGGAETALTAERNKLHAATMGTCIHGTAKRSVTTMDHLGDVFHFNVSGMEGILNDLIIVFEYFL